MKKKQILKTTFYFLLLALIIWIPMSSVIIGIGLFGGIPLEADERETGIDV